MLQKNNLAFKDSPSLYIFLMSRAFAALGTQMVTIAIGWQIYSITKSPMFLGLVGLVQFLPMFLLTLLVGYVADKFNRKRIISVCQALTSLSYFMLAIESFAGGISREKILIIACCLGAINAFQGPSMQSMLPNIVPKEIFPKAAALSASVFQTAVIIGPAIGGILYGLGPGVVYTIAGTLSLIVCLVTFYIKVNQTQTKPTAVTISSLMAGITFIKQKPIILGAISLDLFAVLFGGATALLPVYASKILMVGPIGLGILRSSPAIGALFMSMLLTRHPLKQRVGYILFIAVTTFGLSTILFAISRNLILSILALIILGASDVISVVIRSTLVQMETPDEMRGRVSSVNLLFIGTSNQLGEFESGTTAAFFGVIPAVVIGGIGTLAVVLLWIKIFPELFKVNKLVR